MGQENITIYDTCVKITAGFEGTDYSTIAGNFDEQGISAGIMQWNLGSGTLQAYILNKLNLMAYGYFPVPILPLQTLGERDAVVWAKDVMLDTNGKLLPQWDKAWRRFLTEAAVINCQKRAIDKYFHRAKEMAGRMGFAHDNRRAMAFCFDVAVQSWNLGINAPEANLEQASNILQKYDSKNLELWATEKLNPDQQKLIIAAHYASLKMKPEWRMDFFSRKATIAVGIGWVHGKKWDLKKLFMEN